MHRLGTKAETLKMLYGQLEDAIVLPQLSFTVSEWESNRHGIVRDFEKLSWNRNVIVRSSSLSEDTSGSSQAGKYESIANVMGKEQFEAAVGRVILSYDDDNPDNQVLVQPMLENVALCGVAFTMEPSTHGHYYVINYDATGSTDAVTSGQGKSNRLYYHFKGEKCMDAPDELKQLLKTLGELEEFFGQDNLDVEFAVTEDGTLYILQVRTLCIYDNSAADAEVTLRQQEVMMQRQEVTMQQQEITTQRREVTMRQQGIAMRQQENMVQQEMSLQQQGITLRQQKEALGRIGRKILKAQSHKPFLCGDSAVYSVMTDWNPAEMIGVRPRPLAMSLYREIITDNVWAYQRDNYGYRNLRSFPLMVDFGGLPYIDVRVSFNSFIPAELEEGISEKLVNYYLARLTANPEKHDKAEFEIVFSCYTLDLPERIRVLGEYGFSEEEISKILDALRNVTNHIINHEKGLWRKDYNKLYTLEKRYNEVMSSDMEDIEKVYWLIEDCKRYGTLPFAGLARAAFIAVQLLKSLVSCEILSDEDYEAFMNGVNTVSSGMNRDFGEMSRKSFLKKYGHLRPGTYDINSPRYDEAPELYFDWDAVKSGADDNGTGNNGVDDNNADNNDADKVFKMSLGQLENLRKKLVENGLDNDILELMDFIKTVIEGREYGKFAFTRNVSMVLSLIGKVGEKNGLSKDDCSYIDIHTVMGLYASADNICEKLTEAVASGKKDYKMTCAVTLPPFIADAKSVFGFYYPDSEPNYITSIKASGDVLLLDDMSNVEQMRGRIILIPSADPGYDWIFSHGIGGFITMYGGANSHMAIRAGELGLPAVVGVGGKEFDRYSRAAALEIDAAAKTVRVIR